MEPNKRIDFEVKLGDAAAELEQVKQLSSLALSGWDAQDSEAKLMQGGNLNSVFKVWKKDAADEDAGAIVVRVYTGKTSAISNPKDEIICMRAAFSAGCGTEVLAAFTNGIIFRYILGDLLNPKNYDDENIRRKVAVEIAKFHHVDVAGGEKVLPRTASVIRNFHVYLDNIPEQLGTEKFYVENYEYLQSKAAMSEELEWLKKEVEKVDLQVVFSQGDCWWGNVLYNKEKDSVHLFDYDMSGYDLLPMDIVRFLDSSTFHMDPISWESVTVDEQKRFAREYLETRFKLASKTEAVSDDLVERLFGQILLVKPLMSLTFMTKTFKLQAEFPDINIVSFIREAGARQYHAAKEEYLKYIQTNSIKSIPELN